MTITFTLRGAARLYAKAMRAGGWAARVRRVEFVPGKPVWSVEVL